MILIKIGDVNRKIIYEKDRAILGYFLAGIGQMMKEWKWQL